MYENEEMRKVLCSKLDSFMEKDDRIVVINADLGRADGLLPLEEKYPERAFDAGIAEQNMASVAAGMAAYGMIPFINSFTPFATRRICDQIAISICYAKRSVKIIGSDPGITAELNGGTHMSVEDIGVLRSIPNIVIYEPVDAVQLAESMEQIVSYDGPVYIRLFRKVAPAVFGSGYRFDLFRADRLKEGGDVSIFATGIMVKEALEAGKLLEERNIRADIINVHTLKPIDRETVVGSVRKTGCAVTCENHNVIGGLRSAVAEVLTEACPVYVKAVGIQNRFGEVGKLPFLSKKFGMTANDIAQAAMEVVKKKSPAEAS